MVRIVENLDLNKIDTSDIDVGDIPADFDDKELIDDTSTFVMNHLVTGNTEDIPFKTDLNFTQIEGFVKLYTYDKIFKAQSIMNEDEVKAKKLLDSVIKEMGDSLQKLVVSKNRMGRKEFIDAYKGRSDEGGKHQSWFKRIMGIQEGNL